MAKIKLGNLEFDDDNDSIEYQKRDNPENENEYKNPFEQNPEYSWEKDLKDVGKLEALLNEAKILKPNDQDFKAEFVAKNAERGMSQGAIDLYNANRAWVEILTPRVGSGFPTKIRAKLKKKIASQLDGKLKKINKPATLCRSTEFIKHDRDLSRSYLDISRQIKEIECQKKPKQNNKTIMTSDGHFPIKFGKSCFTCRYSRKSANKIFIECEKFSKPVWKKAQCGHYDLKTVKNDKDWLIKFENKYLDRRVATNPGQRKKYYRKRTYKKYSKDIFLSQACFTCDYFGKERSHGKGNCLIRSNPDNKTSSNMVWELALCEKYKITADKTRFSRFMGSMRKSGADMTKVRWKRSRYDG